MRVCIIPARGGSQRLKNKNRREFCGLPMIAYPLTTAKESGLFDLIVVSTDDTQIARIAFDAGAVVVPRETDDGSTGTQEIAARVLERLNIQSDSACVIYATSPLLDVEHLAHGLSRLLQPDAPAFAYSVGPDGKDAGCFYWGWALAFRNRTPLERPHAAEVVLPEERVCDINTVRDWNEAKRKFNALRRAS